MSGTISGLPTAVLPSMPGTEMLTEHQVARMGGYANAAAMHADIRAGAPSLDGGWRVGGQLNYDANAVRGWLVQLTKYRERDPERLAAQRNEEAKARLARSQARLAAEEARLDWVGERAAFIAQHAAELAAEADGAAPKDNGHVSPFSGGSA